MNGRPTIRFCGAARTVTGSCYLIKYKKISFLVDCGLFQGPKLIKELNYRPFPFEPSRLDFVLLTHAHIDHAGLIPKLVRHGFKGKIYATEGTRDLLTFMLPDSGHIQEMEVHALNQRNERHGRDPVEAIYTQADAEACLEQIESVDYAGWVEPVAGVRARFWNAGHILGSASIEIETGSPANRTRLLFSGDVGPNDKLFHPDPNAPHDFDTIVSESTYGGRIRSESNLESRRAKLAEIASKALDNASGILLIPAFAVERTQELLTDLLALQEDGQIPDVPIFLDSPLAIRVTQVFANHASDLENLGQAPHFLQNPKIRPTQSTEQTKAIARVKGGAIIIAASGMCDAGRIRHHLRQRLWNRNTTVLMPGFQAAGTLGRLLTDGVSPVKIQGEEIAVRARIVSMDDYSGHADGAELVDWILAREPVRSAIFLTHGEEGAMEALSEALEKSGTSASAIVCPDLDDEWQLGKAGDEPTLVGSERRLPPKTIMTKDWHNDLAAFTFELRHAFDQAADDKARAKFLRKLKRALEMDSE